MTVGESAATRARINITAASVTQICSIEGCPNPPRSRGWCDKHYYRWRKYGDPNVFLQEHYVRRGSVPVCKVEGCEGGHEAFGLCRKHYRRLENLRRQFAPSRSEAEWREAIARFQDLIGRVLDLLEHDSLQSGVREKAIAQLDSAMLRVEMELDLIEIVFIAVAFGLEGEER